MRGAVSKRIRRAAQKASKSESNFKKTYKHLKAQYKKTGSIDVVGNSERKAALERKDGEVQTIS